MLYRQTLFLVPRRPDEVNQGEPLAISVGINQPFISADGGSSDRTRSADWLTQIGAGQGLSNSFKRAEEKCFVFFNWTTDSAAKLLTMKIRQGLSVGSI